MRKEGVHRDNNTFAGTKMTLTGDRSCGSGLKTGRRRVGCVVLKVEKLTWRCEDNKQVYLQTGITQYIGDLAKAHTSGMITSPR